MDQNILSKLKQYSTPCISDALDTLGINGGLEGILPMQHDKQIVGPAYTILYEEVKSGEIAPAGEFIEEVPPGSIIVIANKGITFCTVWGDILSLAAQLKGVLGTVIDGCCRDISAISKLNYPMFAKSIYMKSGKNRVRLVAKQIPITIGQTDVNPGDIVVADQNGVIVVPKPLLVRVVEICAAIEHMEQKIVNAIQSGEPLREARKVYKYNNAALNDKVQD